MAGNKRGAGRPPLPEGEGKLRVVGYVSTDHAKRIKVLADADGISVSAVITQLISTALNSEAWQNEYYTASGQRDIDEATENAANYNEAILL